MGTYTRWRHAGVSVLLLMFVVLISPVYISPLFNDYKVLEEGPIRTANRVDNINFRCSYLDSGRNRQGANGCAALLIKQRLPGWLHWSIWLQGTSIKAASFFS